MHKHINKTLLAVLSLNLMGLGHPANANVVLLYESRNVYANASVTTPIGSESVSSSRNSLGDFADFNKFAEADTSLDGASANAMAQQTSQISAKSISASGEAMTNVDLTASDAMFYNC
jgi:hypothetical protein